MRAARFQWSWALKPQCKVPLILMSGIHILKADVLDFVACLHWTPVFEWYVIRCVSENWIPKRIFVQKMISILNSIINIKSGDPCEH